MLKTVICDDDPHILDHYQAVLTKVAENNGITQKIIRFENGEQLLFHLSDEPDSVDIIYLDILMGKMNGIETARKLREIGCTAQIIYLSGSDEFVFESFDVEPYYYMVKDDISLKKFSDIFLKAVDRVNRRTTDYIIVSVGAMTEKIPLEHILYFEVRNRTISVFTTNMPRIDYYATLGSVQQSLQGKSFVRTHRSFLVNCYYIQQLTRTQLTLTNGTVLPVGEKYTHSVHEQFSQYLLEI